MQITGDWFRNAHTQAVCRALTDSGYQALFVGGCVRNALLGRPVNDIDIATDATPETVMALEEQAGFKVVPTGIDHGTVTVVSGSIPHEITTFRHDVETDGRRAVIAFASDVTDDARRRDFTMNALYADPDGTIIDPLGGLADLEARRVRFIENPVDRIREDYLRVLRFFRFHAWYGDALAGIDPEGLAAVADHLEGLGALSRERVGAEMKKLLNAPDPAPSVAAMRATGVLGIILPGADDRALAPLVHAEASLDIEPDAIRRLACLGGEDVPERLRLSQKETKHLATLQSASGTTESPAVVGYRQSFAIARDIILLRAALFGQAPNPVDLDAARKGAEAQFPVRARDLMPEYQGPALGRRMKALEEAWIASGFQLSSKALLALPDEG
ncbi:CCA tRNA nucleotidyltransferase [Aquicoccus porphyridii]|uniref:CCA tRNA nucleotidyltransferase n=1 Tax=Aquicoccus porphyridii TaxID=1852029 RepID=UPI00273DE384|nr:CCA tRNA nucleotidyltransferase [Aquicoccus porphyridii]